MKICGIVGVNCIYLRCGTRWTLLVTFTLQPLYREESLWLVWT